MIPALQSVSIFERVKGITTKKARNFLILYLYFKIPVKSDMQP